MLRNNFSQQAAAVYTLAWGPDSNQLLFGSGSNCIIKSINVDRKQVQWTAHDGIVMKADWNPVTNLVVTGGEDRRYKVWDTYGRQLFQSRPFDYVVTSVAWCPSGEFFSVGSYNLLRLCDKTGWSYCRERPESGSIMQQAWTSDGTQLACAGGNGAVVSLRLLSAPVRTHVSTLCRQKVTRFVCWTLQTNKSIKLSCAIGSSNGH